MRAIIGGDRGDYIYVYIYIGIIWGLGSRDYGLGSKLL